VFSERRPLRYWSSYSRPRLALHAVTSSKYFDLAISAVIGINVITMAMEYHMMPEVSSALALPVRPLLAQKILCVRTDLVRSLRNMAVINSLCLATSLIVIFFDDAF